MFQKSEGSYLVKNAGSVPLEYKARDFLVDFMSIFEEVC